MWRIASLWAMSTPTHCSQQFDQHTWNSSDVSKLLGVCSDLHQLLCRMLGGAGLTYLFQLQAARLALHSETTGQLRSYACLAGSGMAASTALISEGPNPVAVLLCFGLLKPGPIGPCRSESGALVDGRRWRVAMIAVQLKVGGRKKGEEAVNKRQKRQRRGLCRRRRQSRLAAHTGVMRGGLMGNSGPGVSSGARVRKRLVLAGKLFGGALLCPPGRPQPYARCSQGDDNDINDGYHEQTIPSSKDCGVRLVSFAGSSSPGPRTQFRDITTLASHAPSCYRLPTDAHFFLSGSMIRWSGALYCDVVLAACK